MANKIIQQLMRSRNISKAKSKSLNAATPVVEDQTLQTWIKEVSSTIKDIAGSSVRKSELVKAGIVTITNGELQNALTPNEEVNLTVPAAVLNLTANGAYGSITLTWETRPSKYFGQNTIYRSEIDDFGTATQIGSTLSDVYTDYVGNNIKAYYWVRTISKFGIEGDISPSAYAATAIDVAYVLEQLEGHITLSQLDQILRGEISSISDISSGLQEEARLRVLELAALADQLRQESINKAQEIQDKVDGVNATIQQQIIELNDGITTEVNSRLDGDQKSINALEAYKLSNDNAVGTILNKVDLAISTNEVQATTISGLQTNFETVSGKLATKADASNLTLAENKIAEVDGKVVATTENITALGSRVSTVEDEISTKADSSVLVDYATKSETDSAIASKIESYDANLVIGGTNLLLNSEAERTASEDEYMMYEASEHLKSFYEENLGKDVTISFDLKSPVAGYISVYCANNAFHNFMAGVNVKDSDVNQWKRYSVTVKPVRHLTNIASTVSNLEFYGGYGTGLLFSLRKVQIEAGSKATSWSPSPRDTQASLAANANAIQTVTAEVARVNGEVTSQASSISLLQGSLSEVDTKANTAINNAATAQQLANTAVSASEVNASSLLNLNSRMDLAEGSLSNKADATALNDYYTKVQADDKATTIAAGEVSKYDANLVIGGANTYDNETTPIDWLVGSPQISDRNSSDTPNGFLLVGDSSLKSAIRINGVITETGWWTVSFYIKGTQNLPVGFILDIVDGQQFTVRSTADNKWTYIEYSSYVNYVDGTYTFVDFSQITWTYILLKDIKVEKGSKATAWTPTNRHVLGSLSANAAAIQNTNTTVQNIDGRVTANSDSLLQLTSKVDNKADASVLTQYYTRAEADSAIAGKVEEFSSSLSIGGVNQLANSEAARSGSNEYLLYEESAHLRQFYADNQGKPITISCEMLVQVAGHVNIYSSNYSDYTFSASTPWLTAYVWTKVSVTVTPIGRTDGAVYNSGTLEFYAGYGTGRIVHVRKVQIEAGNKATDWAASPRDTQAKLTEQSTTINGIQAVKTVTIDNNGVMSGYGLISELKNGQVTSAFGINADMFYIGSPANNKKPFAVLGSSGFINGVSVPAGTYIDTAYIPNGTITNAKIGDLSADKITTGSIAADRMKANIVAAAQGQFTSLSSISATIGVLRTSTYGARTEIKDNLIEVYDSSGKLRVRLGVWS